MISINYSAICISWRGKYLENRRISSSSILNMATISIMMSSLVPNVSEVQMLRDRKAGDERPTVDCICYAFLQIVLGMHQRLTHSRATLKI
jgi:hypothetical protein